MRGTDAADPRLVLEIALVRLTRREVGPPIQTVMERIEKLEQTVAGQRATGSATRPDPPAAPEPRAPRVTVGALRKRRPEPTPPADPAPHAAAPDESDDIIVESDEGATPPGVESASPANMLTESLGATVVEERHHE